MTADNIEKPAAEARAAPFAVTTDDSGHRVIDNDMYLTISRAPKLDNNKRHFTSTARFKPHSVEDADRSTKCQVDSRFDYCPR